VFWSANAQIRGTGKICDVRPKLQFSPWKRYKIGPWLLWITNRKS